MSNQRIKMQKLKKLIELTISGTAQRPISTLLGIHPRTVVNYQGLLKSHTGGDLNPNYALEILKGYSKTFV